MRNAARRLRTRISVLSLEMHRVRSEPPSPLVPWKSVASTNRIAAGCYRSVTAGIAFVDFASLRRSFHRVQVLPDGVELFCGASAKDIRELRLSFIV